MKKNCNVGGQAVIEGVMMRGSKGIATAVRLPDGSIDVDFNDTVPLTKKYKILSLPVIRGFVSLLDSLIEGIKTLNYSASFFEEETEETKFDKALNKMFKEKTSDVILGFSLILSFTIAIMLFFILPTFAAGLFKRNITGNTVILNLIEGLIRIIIFLLYIFFVGKMEDIYRVYQYHGAEHKTIFCYENEEELTPLNANKFGRLHKRCGTNFLFLVMIVSILIFSLTGWNSLQQRILSRVLLLPVVSGVTYEIIRWMGKNDGKISYILAYPGLMLQKLTTKEPTLDMLEVAIAALKASEGIEDQIKVENIQEEIPTNDSSIIKPYEEIIQKSIEE